MALMEVFSIQPAACHHANQLLEAVSVQFAHPSFQPKWISGVLMHF